MECDVFMAALIYAMGAGMVLGIKLEVWNGAAGLSNPPWLHAGGCPVPGSVQAEAIRWEEGNNDQRISLDTRMFIVLPFLLGWPVHLLDVQHLSPSPDLAKQNLTLDSIPDNSCAHCSLRTPGLWNKSVILVPCLLGGGGSSWALHVIPLLSVSLYKLS